jgi:hypothetical protein
MGGEFAIIGIQSASPNGRRLAKKPREKSQFLQVVCKSVKGNSRQMRTAQRIAHFKVRLTTLHLSDSSPSRRWISAQRVVHPFPYFVTREGNISTVEPGGVEVRHPVGLQHVGGIVRGVITPNPASGWERTLSKRKIGRFLGPTPRAASDGMSVFCT